jgi:chromosome segregation ATPase
MPPLPSPDNRALQEIANQLSRIERNTEEIMSGLSDLTSAESQESADINTLVGVVTALISDLKAALANDDSDAAVEAASQIVTQQDQQLQAITAQLQGADPGAPATPPVTPPAAS